MYMKRNAFWKVCGITSSICSLIPLFMGLNKMLIYDNSGETINAYVGGDAYNYIINANYSTAFFVLFGVLLLAGIGFIGLWYLSGIVNEKEHGNDIIDELPDM